MAVLEIFTFPASEAFQKDPQLNRDVFELIIRISKGLQRIYVATGTEEPNITCFVLAWDSYEDHKALMDHKDYPEVGEKLKPLLGGEPKMVHIAFGDDTRPALTYPLTQVTTLELKDKQDPEKKEAFKTAMVEMIDDCHRLPNAKQRASFCFGETREHPGTFYLLGGWNSVEQHKQAIDLEEEGVRGVELVKQLSNIKMNYVHVKEYEFRRD